MSKIKIGVIGLGFMGLSHARNIAGGKCPGSSLPRCPKSSRRVWSR